MNIIFNSKQLKHKKPFGCTTPGEEITLHIHVPRSCVVLSGEVHIEGEDFKQKIPLAFFQLLGAYDVYEAVFTLKEPGLYFYWFWFHTAETDFSLYKQGESGTNIEVGEKWQLTVYPKSLESSKEFTGAVMYQIFPDRFHQAEKVDLHEKLEPYFIHENTLTVPDFAPNEEGEVLNCDFYGGNLRGIAEKLPYLKALGVSWIYLNPIFYAYSNHRYDTADYSRIDPMLGTLADFSYLCNAAHNRGIGVILDGVFSHTGSNSIYFDKENRFGKGAYHHEDSPYRSWFSFHNTPPGYDAWWGIATLPAVKELEPSYLHYIIEGEDSIIAKYLRLGADGFRLDVADELPDEFIKKLVDRVKKENPKAVVIGEVWEDASNKISYGVRKKYFTYCQLNSVMNYPFRSAILELVKGWISPNEFMSRVMTVLENYPQPVVHSLMNSLSTHDTIRLLSFIGEPDLTLSKEEQSKRFIEDLTPFLPLLKLAVLLQYMLPGNPCIYYGDEVGLSGLSDPFNRLYFPWENICQELLSFYQELGRVKNSYPPLQKGRFRPLKSENGVLKFIRYLPKHTILCLANFSDLDYNEKRTSFSCIMKEGVRFEKKQMILSPGGFFIGEYHGKTHDR